MDIVEVPISEIKPYQRNPRKNDSAVDAVAKSIQEFGFRQPIVVDKDGIIIVGHTRYKAAKKLELKTVPVHYADLDEQKAKAYRLADNKTNELSDWDFELLDLELDGVDMDLGDFGFDLGGDEDEGESSVSTEKLFHYKEQYGVIVMCGDESEQEQVYNRLTEDGYECRVVTV